MEEVESEVDGTASLMRTDSPVGSPDCRNQDWGTGTCSLNTLTEDMDHLMRLINMHGISICGILESHLKPDNIQVVCRKLFKGWNWITNMVYCDSWVRIIISWDPCVTDMMAIEQNDQAMHCLAAFGWSQ
ncbi:hypothetical protein L1987_74325 [Smallanthus sonchifolius]|uniref:Uncharacterized protein n=1 Tax=Smallanthus sonchifolius TaxID=185202 RepID=A0ACB9A2Q0_9ASTR|nr:hypothetical protein L1987_74325 [Smallanthus sonchifolius]